MKLYLVGGAVRNRMLDEPVSDYDFAVEADSFEEMESSLVSRGLMVWMQAPEFALLRGRIRFPDIAFGGLLSPSSQEWNRGEINADFTLCRAEAMYSDLRHPSVVTPADLLTDLSRRDFTVNAVAVSENGTWIDPHQGQADADSRMLSCVGDPTQRMTEDPLRMLRAIRFAVRYRMSMDHALLCVLQNPRYHALLGSLPVERVRRELRKAFAADWWLASTWLLPTCGPTLHDLFPTLWLKPTTEER